MHFLVVAFILLYSIFFIGCGGSSSGDVEDEEQVTEEQDQQDETVESDDTINTEKLIGTPLEGLTRSDDVDGKLFLCGGYRTETVDSFPIKIFTAFFYKYDEETIQEAVDFVNEIIGFEAYQITEEWSDDVRLIYASDSWGLEEGAGGSTFSLYMSFNGKRYAEVVAADWAIVLDERYSVPVHKYTVAHELGHATGIRNHKLIDYENDDTKDLEENSLMSAWPASDPTLTHYSFMMKKQGETMRTNLGRLGVVLSDRCD